MKINSINNLYNPFKTIRLNSKNSTSTVTSPFLNNNFAGDVVVFRAKAYSAESIENPTNHCAYCGAKVYTEAQIESIAKSMLQYKSHRLHGEIKSILEKLDTAERSYELTVAKQIENREEIAFFKKFLEQAMDKSFLKGDAIFQQVYSLEYDEAFELLKKNMKPLTRTIDHVSPQNLGEDNKDEEINLVEACYCCNHDLKRGMPFSEFYTMYPSIKENMPADKFKYAHAQLLSSSDSVLHKLSATNLIKLLSGLFEQRDRVLSQLDSVDFRIAESATSVQHSIDTCNSEIRSKEVEIEELTAKLATISSDQDYIAMLRRISLLKQKTENDAELASLRDKRKNISDSLNDLRNEPKKGKKVKSKLSDDQKEQKIASYRFQLMELNQNISDKEVIDRDLLLQIAQLDAQYPTIEMLQAEKYSFDAIATAHNQLNTERQNLEQLTKIRSLHSFDAQKLENEIAQYPDGNFDVSKYSQEEQVIYSSYMSHLEALKYIEQHSNGGGVRSLVNKSAKVQIEQELERLQSIPVIVVAAGYLRRKELSSQLETIKKQLSEVSNQISSSQNKIRQLERKTADCSLDKAQEQSKSLSVRIRELTEKQNYLKIPQTIEKLEAEILLLNSTIKSLEVQQAQIASLTGS